MTAWLVGLKRGWKPRSGGHAPGASIRDGVIGLRGGIAEALVVARSWVVCIDELAEIAA